MKRLLHISDLHFGPPYVKEAGEAILDFQNEGKIDVVVITGDLTQRARTSQFVSAAAFITKLRLHSKVVVIPGNHDIPLYRFWERLFSPYRLFKSLISQDRNTVLHEDEFTIVGLDSTHPLKRIKNGRLGSRRLAFCEEALKQSQPGATKIVALHHPLLLSLESELPGGLLEKFSQWGVNVVMSGHAHTRLVKKSGSIMVVQCGTSTSSRGRGEEAGKNSINVVNLESHQVKVDQLEFDPAKKQFVCVAEFESLK